MYILYVYTVYLIKTNIVYILLQIIDRNLILYLKCTDCANYLRNKTYLLRMHYIFLIDHFRNSVDTHGFIATALFCVIKEWPHSCS